MPNILQIPVPVGNAAPVWSSRQTGVNSLLFINQDLNNTVWLGSASNITAAGANTIPILPNGTFSGDAQSQWYVVGSVAGTQPLVVVPNGQAYFLGITQGLGNLVIPAIRSPNFVHGVSGWQIAKDGSAEFNNLTIRGTFFGLDFILNSAGLFLYSSTPTLGNLIASVAIANGTDSFGNVYYAGFCSQNPGLAIGQLNQGFLKLGTPAGFAGTGGAVTANISSLTQGEISLFSGQQASADTGMFFNVTSAQENGLGVPAAFSGAPIQISPTVTAPNSASAGPFLIAGPSSSAMAIMNIAGMIGTIPLTQAVQGGNTNNTTSMNAMFTPFGIPAHDAKNGTAYEIECGGHGTQAATTATTLNFQLFAFGLAWALSTDNGNVVAGGNFHWHFKGTLILGDQTNNAPASFFGMMTISQSSASAQGHPTAMDQQRASGVDTTVSTNVTLQAGWTSVVNSPTLVCTGATFKRIGL